MSIESFITSSFSLEEAVSNQELTFYVIVGSIFISVIAYVFAGLWMVLSLDLSSHLTIRQAFLVWGGFVIWGVLSSIFFTSMLAIFIIQVLTSARSSGDSAEATDAAAGVDVDDVGETLEHAGSLTPQYVLSIGISMGVLLNYRNIGRGWI